MTLIWKTCDGPTDVHREGALQVLTAAGSAIAADGLFRLVLSGGKTPAGVYSRLREAKTDWSRWHIYFSDERCVTPDDPERNSRMAGEQLLDHVPIPRSQVHVIDAEQGASVAAVRYSAQVSVALPFHLVMLGVGEDGHTASLFPGQVIDTEALAVPVLHAPKPPASRVSLGLRALRSTKAVLVLACGVDKRQAIDTWRRHQPSPVCSVTDGLDGLVLLDRAADPACSVP